jgi:type IV pilus assembly protein PilW
MRLHFISVTAQAGFTLAELMVALVLGLGLSLLTVSLLVSSNLSFAMQAEAADVDEAGRYAVHAVASALRQAAFVDWTAVVDADDGAPAPLAGLDASTVPRSGEGLADAIPRSVNGSDVLAVRFQSAADGGVLNCAGFQVTDAARGWSIFYVAQASDGEAELLCKYRGSSNWSAGALVRGVDSFQILYGVDTDEPRDGVPNRYLTATQIAALDAVLALVGDTSQERIRDLNRRTAWKRVVTVRLALLMHGTGRVRRDGALRAYDLFGPDYAPGDDPGTRIDEAALPEAQRLRERRLFSATVSLRNLP